MSGIKVVSQNKKSRYDYHLVETFEAGISLKGTEIKSIRANQVTLAQAYVVEHGGELWLIDANIAPYAFGHRDNHEPKRRRKLLLHRKEINEIMDKLAQKGLTCVPTKMYLKNGRAKVEIALGRGKKKHDKRQDVAKKDAKRNIQKALKHGRY